MSSLLPDFLDCLIVSGGIVGLTVVRVLRNRYPAAKITELKKRGTSQYTRNWSK